MEQPHTVSHLLLCLSIASIGNTPKSSNTKLNVKHDNDCHLTVHRAASHQEDLMTGMSWLERLSQCALGYLASLVS
jgi:hypothetical protein